MFEHFRYWRDFLWVFFPELIHASSRITKHWHPILRLGEDDPFLWCFKRQLIKYIPWITEAHAWIFFSLATISLELTGLPLAFYVSLSSSFSILCFSKQVFLFVPFPKWIDKSFADLNSFCFCSRLFSFFLYLVWSYFISIFFILEYLWISIFCLPQFL